MEQFVKKICDPLFEKINLLISICSINKVNDETKTQTTQVELFTDEIREDVERWQNYGISSVPPKDSEGLCVFISGERDRGYIVATEDKDSRPTNLQEGEVCIYTIEKDKIYFKKGNKIDIVTKEVNINSSDKINFDTKETLIQTDKIKIKNDTCELIQILYDLIDELSKTNTNTLIGQMPLNCFPKLLVLKEKIKTFI